MTYGICALSLIPIREASQHNAPLVSEVLYGDIFKIITSQKFWSKVRLQDKTEGWINNTQFQEISVSNFEELVAQPSQLATDLVEFIYKDSQILFAVPIGSLVHRAPFLGHRFEGATSGKKAQKESLRDRAFMFINTPFHKGGQSPFGIDADGFVQTVYALCGILLPRTATAQAEKGHVLSFIEESEPGDLAFFDNSDGEIVHVGIILENNHIIHAHGHVRVDRLDKTGIFNPELRTHTHKLRLIKSIA